MTRARSRPTISVVICTRNRAGSVCEAIESAAAQTAVQPEIIVVDNGSTDDTATRVARLGLRLVYLQETAPGLSKARNLGWRAARGELVAFLDDDAIADDGWLAALADAFGSIDPSPACVGGRVSPVWEAPRPGWLSDRLLMALTVADWGAVRRPITDLTVEWLVGANLAFRRTELERLGGFPELLGRRGRSLLSGEEIFLQRRLIREGSVCLYEPRAHVRHRIPAERLRATWFCRRLFAQGVSDAVALKMEGATPDRRTVAAWARELALTTRAGLDWLLPWPDAGSRNRVERATSLCWRLGYLTGLVKGA